MEKPSTVILYYNGVPKISIPIYNNGTVAQLKQLIHNVTTQYQLPYTQLIFRFNDNTQLDNVVFATNQYDNVTFGDYADRLNGSKLYLSGTILGKPTPVAKKKLYTREELQRLKVAELRDILKKDKFNKRGLRGKKANLINRILTSEEQLQNKNNEYYNLYQGELSGQISDGLWENRNVRYYDFTELIPYVGNRMLFLGAAQKVGLNIQDDPWIENIGWIFFSKNIEEVEAVVNFIRNNDLDTVLNNFLQKQEQRERDREYWINEAREMINNKNKMRRIWDYIGSGNYNENSLITDLRNFSEVYSN